jgi:hypothetical protein
MREFMEKKECVMKKNCLIGLSLAGVLGISTLTGCTSTGNEAGKTGLSFAESIGENKENAKDNEGGSKDNKGAGEEGSTSSESVAGEQQNAAETGTVSELYESFMEGQTKVKYRGTGDMASYIELSAVLTPGESYTIFEIRDKAGIIDDFVQYKPQGDAEFSYIDCGSDGSKELLVKQAFAADDMYEVFTLNMIIKDIDGELYICWDQDTWSRSDVTVNEDGTIEGGGSGGAALHYTDLSFVDANGDYHYFYGLESYMTPYGDYYSYRDGDYTLVSLEGLDNEHLAIDAYYFDSDPEKRSDYPTYSILDDNYNDVTTDADYSDDNEVMKRFRDAGINIYTRDEINDILDKRAGEIGYPGSNY